MRPGHAGTRGLAIAAIADRRTDAGTGRDDIRMQPPMRSRSARGKSGDVVADVSRADGEGLRVDRRWHRHAGTGGAGIASRHHHENPGLVRIGDGFGQNARIGAAFRRRAAPGIDHHMRRQLRTRIAAIDSGRRQKPLQAVQVGGGRPVSRVHVAAADPARFRRHADLVRAGIIANRRAHRVGAVVVVIAGRGRSETAGRIECASGDGVAPVVIVAGDTAVPAPVLRAQRRMVPLVAGVLATDHHALAAITQRPDLRCAHPAHAPFHRLHGGRLTLRLPHGLRHSGTDLRVRRQRHDIVTLRQPLQDLRRGVDLHHVGDPERPMRNASRLQFTQQRGLADIGAGAEPINLRRDPARKPFRPAALRQRPLDMRDVMPQMHQHIDRPGGRIEAQRGIDPDLRGGRQQRRHHTHQSKAD